MRYNDSIKILLQSQNTQGKKRFVFQETAVKGRLHKACLLATRWIVHILVISMSILSEASSQ